MSVFFFFFFFFFLGGGVGLGGRIIWSSLLIPLFVSFFQCNHTAEEERVGCLVLIVFLLSCGCYRSVSLLRGATDWFVF